MALASSPARLAWWLCVPLLLMTALGVWLLRAERAQAEMEWRRDAEKWAVFALQSVASASTEESVAALAVRLPSTAAPPPGPEAEALVAARDALHAGRQDEAIDRLEALRQRPGVEAAVTASGMPVVPLVHRLIYEIRADAMTAESLAQAAVRHPSLLSPALVEDAAASLSPEEGERWRQRTRDAVALARALSRGHPTPQWYVEPDPDGSASATPLAEVSRLVHQAAAGTKEFLPPGMNPIVAWSGQTVVANAGPELATATRPPWRVGIVLSDARALESAAAQRVRWLGLLLAAGLAVTSFALWVAWRAFRRQAELTSAQMEFVASVSHELRTPVASITAMAERLESGQADAAQTAEYHRFIGREGRRLAALVENVLDFSRLERGKRAFVLEPVNLPALVQETAALMRPRAEEKGLTLDVNIARILEDRWPTVDALALRQALVNLLDNAIKFTPASGRIELELAEENGAVIIRVSDTGIGIDPHERTRIFERFYRVDNSLTRETTGVGIGLSLVRQIAEAHGASVHVDSDPGHSARFTLRFPPTPCASS